MAEGATFNTARLNNPWLLGSVAIPLVIVYVVYRWMYKPLQYFKSIGVPGPKPALLTGNFTQLASFEGGRIPYMGHLFEKYGPICGFYNMHRPFLVIHDPDFVKQITIKEFDKFMNRFGNGSLVPYWTDDGKAHDGLLISSGRSWKKARNVSTPAFSTHKMKLMESLIRTSTSKLAEKFESVAETGQTVNVTAYFGKMTMEVILATAFGRDLDVQNGQGGKLYQAAKDFMCYFQANITPWKKLMLLIQNAFPQATLLFRSPMRFSLASRSKQCMGDSLKVMMDQRKQNRDAGNRKDVLQLILDANAGSEEKLSDGQMVATSISFLLGGYETTSSTLSFASYCLALNPDVQDRLANEIHDYLSANPDGSLYDAAGDIEYLGMVLDETLRLYSPGTALLRLCREDCVVNGIPIKKGVSVSVPLYSYHRLQDVWPDPEKFDPDRFTAEEKAKRHPYAYLPFGSGPRNCVGMRLALLEVKIALIELLNKYKLVPSEETEIPMKLIFAVTLAVKNGVSLKIEHRQWD